MEAAHWHARWQEGRIGFHTGKPNPWLQRFYPALALGTDEQILLPLCGKSADLVWLAEQGQRVLGVELSPIALQQLFEEQQLNALRTKIPPFIHWSSGPITLLEGDFFDLSSAQLGHCSALFDRAALVALPPEMRQRYVRHLATLLPSASRILLVTTDYPQQQKSPPPFAVSDAEVKRLYQHAFGVERLHSEDLSSTQDPLSQRGVTSLVENIYLITRR
jgi:thiopurine S-methyltransferase